MEEGWLGRGVSVCQAKECTRRFRNPLVYCARQRAGGVMEEMDVTIKGREKVRCVRIQEGTKEGRKEGRE